MQKYFYQLADKITSLLNSNEFIIINLTGEQSDFVRLNHNRIRQAGNVLQMSITLDLIEADRHAAASCNLMGDIDNDIDQLTAIVHKLREQRVLLPADPYLFYATEICSSEYIAAHNIPATQDAITQITYAAKSLDLVGIWASGSQFHGFANSIGQRNWHCNTNFNFDWSIYHSNDKAVKSDYAGFDWDTETFDEKLQASRQALAVMARPEKKIKPGRYRVYLAPAAMCDLMNMMAWQGYGLKSHRTAQTPLIKMIKEDKRLNPAITIIENHRDGIAARFTQEGFIKPEQIILIQEGRYQDCLVSARSACEYNAQVNVGSEFPRSLMMTAGDLPLEEILTRLNTGIYINNLWYCNFSDHNDCRITGMTRYACFWVENGEIIAPINVMRFDESIYQMFGENLLDLTREREFIFDSSSYEQRSTTSYHLPGALVEDFTLTL